MNSLVLIIIVAAVVLPLVLFLILKAFWKVPSADEALVITGWGVGTNEQGNALYKVVLGKGAMVIPVFQRLQRISLRAYQVSLNVNGFDQQKIPVGVQGSVVFKIADDPTSITNAVTRFLDEQDERGGENASKMQANVKEVIHGHLRSMLGGLSIEDLIGNQNQLASRAREVSGDEIQKLGLTIDSLQIQEINDPTGYIKALGEPRSQEVLAEAAKATALRERESAEAQEENKRLVAEAEKETAIKRAAYQTEQDIAQANADAAGPRQAAEAEKAVVQRQTEVAELTALQTERQLESSVKKPADAQRYARTVAADAAKAEKIAAAEAEARETELAGEAESKAMMLRGQAEAEAIRAKGLAEAQAIEARAKALEVQAEAVIAQTAAEQLPAIVTAAAKAFDNVETLTVFNGAEGLNKMLLDTIGIIGPVIGQVKDLTGQITTTNTNGTKTPGPEFMPPRA